MNRNPLQRQKALTERLYIEVKNASPALYERAVQIASITPGLTLDQRAALERHCMSLISETLSFVNVTRNEP
jgi:hypothetical protein